MHYGPGSRLASRSSSICASRCPGLAQTPPAGQGPEVQIYEKFRTWTTQQPFSGSDPGLLDRYRAGLTAEGLSAAEIDRHLRVITEQGQQLEIDAGTAS